jgi:hypothetical protein
MMSLQNIITEVGHIWLVSYTVFIWSASYTVFIWLASYTVFIWLASYTVFISSLLMQFVGARGGAVFEALRCKPEGCRIDSRSYRSLSLT